MNPLAELYLERAENEFVAAEMLMEVSRIEAFESSFVKTGKLDVWLLMIYKKIFLRAEKLLDIYFLERRKRGDYTYKKLPQANMEPAKESLDNAALFFKAIGGILRK